jgi:transcriptional regulator with XRE-family HTH domain
VPDHVQRELVITVPLPNDTAGLQGDGRPKVRRFHSHFLDLEQQLRAFRTEHDLTQEEVARVVGASDRSPVAQWELGVTVPEGLRRERMQALLAGQLWPEVRAAMIEGAGMPQRWVRAAWWYRRASRERPRRDTVGVAVAAVLEHLRTVDALEGLCQRYCADDGSWVQTVAAQRLPEALEARDLRLAEDAAYGLRWLEIRYGLRLDLHRSLVRQVSLTLLEGLVGETMERASSDREAGLRLADRHVEIPDC